MNRRLELAERRGRLRERIAAQRELVAEESAPLVDLASRADRVVAWGRKAVAAVKSKPYLSSAAFASLLVIKPRRAFRAARWGWVAWRLVKWWRTQR
jgi:hypothetical protein